MSRFAEDGSDARVIGAVRASPPSAVLCWSGRRIRVGVMMTPWGRGDQPEFVIFLLTVWNKFARNINFAVDFVSQV